LASLRRAFVGPTVSRRNRFSGGESRREVAVSLLDMTYDRRRRREFLCIALIFGSPLLAATTAILVHVIDRYASASVWLSPVARFVVLAGAVVAVGGSVAGCLSLRDRTVHRVVAAMFVGPAAFLGYCCAYGVGAALLSGR